MSCASCHRAFPELTPFGRNFKLNGYTLTTARQLEEKGDVNGNNGLKLNAPAPISAMMITAISNTATPTDTDAQNTSFAFPQQLSLFYAGEISANIGAFLQMTYEQESDNLSWDNAEFRYAQQADNLVYGITLNNSPTVQDLWNSTSVWGYPYTSSPAAASPANATLLEGMLSQDVAGLGAYGMWSNRFYAELSLYKSAHLGEVQPNAASVNTLDNFSPYWRLAWTPAVNDGSFMLGMYGMQANIHPSGTTGATDDYSDIAIDTQYQGKSFSVHASYITEQRTLNASNPSTAPGLASLKLDGTYFINAKNATTLSYFDSQGDSNTAWGTASNLPDSSGIGLQYSYMPGQNIRLGAQYMMYSKFDGASSGAADNNSLYLFAWLMW